MRTAHCAHCSQSAPVSLELPISSAAIGHTYSWLFNPLIHAAMNNVGRSEQKLVSQLQTCLGQHWTEIMSTVAENARDPSVALQVRSIGEAYLPPRVQEVCIGYASNAGMRAVHAFAEDQHRIAVRARPDLVRGSCEVCSLDASIA